jgi:ABC-type Fe3+ transport system permease subunit
MSIVGRAIGLFVLCVLVGLLLETIGISARGILYDTWHTIGAMFRRLADLLDWSLPYALLGAGIVVPLTLLSFFKKRRRRGRWTRSVNGHDRTPTLRQPRRRAPRLARHPPSFLLRALP